MPSFEDADGNPTATNLTTNVVNNTSGVAEKYTVRYELRSIAYSGKSFIARFGGCD